MSEGKTTRPPTLEELGRLSEAATTQYPGYMVTPDGRVWSVASNWRGYGVRALTTQVDVHGYLRVKINNRLVKVHKLVAAAFLPSRPPGSSELRHLDGDRKNNAAANLRWGTAQENAEDRERHGRTARGVRNGWSRAHRRALETT